jgi:hypothetical protein
VRREMDKQKEANEKRFHDRATLNRDISEIRGSINASLYNLLKQDECRVDALNDRIKKLQDQRKLGSSLFRVGNYHPLSKYRSGMYKNQKHYC